MDAMTTTGERTGDECTAITDATQGVQMPRPNKIFSWTVDRLPRDARQKKDSGLPFGAFVSPFGEMKKRRTLSSEASVTKKREEAAKIAISRSINGRNEAVNLAIIKLRNISAQSETTRKKGLGHFDVDLLQKGADTFKSLGLIEAELDMNALIKTDLIPN